ncbi:MAG: trigger factor [Mycoplasmatales bacterium]|nr:trigger factor [Mycoplasmatales bacterium]
MSKSELNKKTSEFLVTLTADEKVWKDAQEQSLKELTSKLELKGFRKGKVPANIAKKHISEMQKMENAITRVLDELVKEAAKEIKEDLMILDSPTYKINKLSNTELEVTFIYPIYPEFEMPDYKKLEVKYEESKFDQKNVDQEMKKIVESKSTLEPKEGKIEKGDSAIFDFEGSVDGKLFDGGTSENFTLEIGSGQFIPGFEDQMIGLKKGDEKDIKVTFPKEYHADDLKGKEAVFKIKVNEVKAKKDPEVNQEFVESLGVPGIKSEKELREYIEKILLEQNRQASRAKFQREAFGKLLEKTEIVLPAALITKEMKNQESIFIDQLKQQGLTLEKYIEMTGMQMEVLKSQFKSQAESKLKESLIFAEIAKEEKIVLKEEDYEKEYSKLAKVYGQSEETIKGAVTKEQMQIPMTNDRVIDALIGFSK